LIFINDDHVLLDGLNGHQLRLKQYLFDSNFQSFIYNKEVEPQESEDKK
jgi:hypothetical protein